MVSAESIAELPAVRHHDSRAARRALEARRRPDTTTTSDGGLFLLAADHPARAALRAGDDPVAMENRSELLSRLCLALAQPGVDGVLGSADVIEDLALLGVLEDKVVLGSMNRGGLPGTVFEADDRFTGYTPAGIRQAGLEGGKMLLRIDPEDPGTARTLEACAHAVDRLAEDGLIALVEPFWSRRTPDGLANILTAEATARAAVVASGLGSTSAHTWLKLPAVPDVERVLSATSLPALLLGGEVSMDPLPTYAAWRRALRHPAAIGLVAGRSMLYPTDGDVGAAVRAAAAIVHQEPPTG